MLRFVYITCISVNTGHSLNLYACVDDVIMTSGECSDSTSVFFFFTLTVHLCSLTLYTASRF